MKKALLLLVTAVVAGVLILGCAQPEFDGSSLNVNNYGVEAPQNVAATAYTGAVRITWDAPKTPVSGYRIIRKIKDSDAEPVAVTTTATLGSTATVAVDASLTGPTKLENGTYIYKVVAYNSADVGAATAESEEIEVTVTVPAVGSIIALPATPTLAEASSYLTSSQAAWTTTWFNLKLSGLDPAYRYQYQIQYNDTPAVASGWTDAGGTGNNGTLTVGALSDVTFEGVDYIAWTGTRTPATRAFRVVLTITVSTGTPYNANDWAVNTSAISPAPTDATLSAANIVVAGTF